MHLLVLVFLCEQTGRIWSVPLGQHVDMEYSVLLSPVKHVDLVCDISYLSGADIFCSQVSLRMSRGPRTCRGVTRI